MASSTLDEPRRTIGGRKSTNIHAKAEARWKSAMIAVEDLASISRIENVFGEVPQHGFLAKGNRVLHATIRRPCLAGRRQAARQRPASHLNQPAGRHRYRYITAHQAAMCTQARVARLIAHTAVNRDSIHAGWLMPTFFRSGSFSLGSIGAQGESNPCSRRERAVS